MNELSPMVNLYTGDTLRAMVLGGVNYTLRVAEPFWLMAEGFFGSVGLDTGVPIRAASGDTFFLSDFGIAYNMKIHLGLTEKAWRADFYTAIGVSYMRFGDEHPWGGFIGGGVTAHTPLNWLALRADLKAFFYGLDNSAGSDFNNDTTLALGPVVEF